MPEEKRSLESSGEAAQVEEKIQQIDARIEELKQKLPDEKILELQKESSQLTGEDIWLLDRVRRVSDEKFRKPKGLSALERLLADLAMYIEEADAFLEKYKPSERVSLLTGKIEEFKRKGFVQGRSWGAAPAGRDFAKKGAGVNAQELRNTTESEEPEETGEERGQNRRKAKAGRNIRRGEAREEAKAQTPQQPEKKPKSADERKADELHREFVKAANYFLSFAKKFKDETLKDEERQKLSDLEQRVETAKNALAEGAPAANLEILREEVTNFVEKNIDQFLPELEEFFSKLKNEAQKLYADYNAAIDALNTANTDEARALLQELKGDEAKSAVSVLTDFRLKGRRDLLNLHSAPEWDERFERAEKYVYELSLQAKQAAGEKAAEAQTAAAVSSAPAAEATGAGLTKETERELQKKWKYAVKAINNLERSLELETDHTSRRAVATIRALAPRYQEALDILDRGYTPPKFTAELKQKMRATHDELAGMLARYEAESEKGKAGEAPVAGEEMDVTEGFEEMVADAEKELKKLKQEFLDIAPRFLERVEKLTQERQKEISPILPAVIRVVREVLVDLQIGNKVEDIMEVLQTQIPRMKWVLQQVEKSKAPAPAEAPALAAEGATAVPAQPEAGVAPAMVLPPEFFEEPEEERLLNELREAQEAYEAAKKEAGGFALRGKTKRERYAKLAKTEGALREKRAEVIQYALYNNIDSLLVQINNAFVKEAPKGLKEKAMAWFTEKYKLLGDINIGRWMGLEEKFIKSGTAIAELGKGGGRLKRWSAKAAGAAVASLPKIASLRTTIGVVLLSGGGALAAAGTGAGFAAGGAVVGLKKLLFGFGGSGVSYEGFKNYSIGKEETSGFLKNLTDAEIQNEREHSRDDLYKRLAAIEARSALDGNARDSNNKYFALYKKLWAELKRRSEASAEVVWTRLADDSDQISKQLEQMMAEFKKRKRIHFESSVLVGMVGGVGIGNFVKELGARGETLSGWIKGLVSGNEYVSGDRASEQAAEALGGVSADEVDREVAEAEQAPTPGAPAAEVAPVSTVVALPPTVEVQPPPVAPAPFPEAPPAPPAPPEAVASAAPIEAGREGAPGTYPIEVPQAAVDYHFAFIDRDNATHVYRLGVEPEELGTNELESTSRADAMNRFQHEMERELGRDNFAARILARHPDWADDPARPTPDEVDRAIHRWRMEQRENLGNQLGGQRIADARAGALVGGRLENGYPTMGFVTDEAHPAAFEEHVRINETFETVQNGKTVEVPSGLVTTSTTVEVPVSGGGAAEIAGEAAMPTAVEAAPPIEAVVTSVAPPTVEVKVPGAPPTEGAGIEGVGVAPAEAAPVAAARSAGRMVERGMPPAVAYEAGARPTGEGPLRGVLAPEAEAAEAPPTVAEAGPAEVSAQVPEAAAPAELPTETVATSHGSIAFTYTEGRISDVDVNFNENLMPDDTQIASDMFSGEERPSGVAEDDMRELYREHLMLADLRATGAGAGNPQYDFLNREIRASMTDIAIGLDRPAGELFEPEFAREHGFMPAEASVAEERQAVPEAVGAVEAETLAPLPEDVNDRWQEGISSRDRDALRFMEDARAAREAGDIARQREIRQEIIDRYGGES